MRQSHFGNYKYRFGNIHIAEVKVKTWPWQKWRGNWWWDVEIFADEGIISDEEWSEEMAVLISNFLNHHKEEYWFFIDYFEVEQEKIEEMLLSAGIEFIGKNVNTVSYKNAEENSEIRLINKIFIKYDARNIREVFRISREMPFISWWLIPNKKENFEEFFKEIKKGGIKKYKRYLEKSEILYIFFDVFTMLIGLDEDKRKEILIYLQKNHSI